MGSICNNCGKYLSNEAHQCSNEDKQRIDENTQLKDNYYSMGKRSIKLEGDIMLELQGYDKDKCFPEDYSHENGKYLNMCSECKDVFIGHKRRVTCKLCLCRNKEQADGIH